MKLIHKEVRFVNSVLVDNFFFRIEVARVLGVPVSRCVTSHAYMAVVPEISAKSAPLYQAVGDADANKVVLRMADGKEYEMDVADAIEFRMSLKVAINKTYRPPLISPEVWESMNIPAHQLYYRRLQESAYRVP